ncbi:hypothetical protein [Salinivibrio sp. KP-1]|uniref:hypothetical protein n=1 Tax=Salinivibrio sp. KP-1 TaxID=1406902 RepID=UPI0006147A61|nr:hypothetical protein [Salinivibrio sp. KP-1]KKA45139.1 hypothetical protein WN56_06925 [Salinivibrio sp. KP-1]
MSEPSYNEIQDAIFGQVSEAHSDDFEKQITMCSMHAETHDDLQRLVDQKKIQWVPSLKAGAATTGVSNPKHMVHSVIYYGTPSSGYACIGYTIGCLRHDKKAVEIDFLEKRNDAGNEWCHKFLPLIVDAYAAYALYLNNEELANIEQIVFTGPVPGVRSYYTDLGMEWVDDYDSRNAFVMYLHP